MEQLPLRDLLLVILGGLLGWVLDKLPNEVVYGFAALAIIIGVLVLRGSF